MNRNLAVKGSKTLAVAAVFLASLAVSAVARAEDSRGLAGTWRVTVQIQNCATGATVGPPFHSLLSFHSGGTLGGTTMNPIFPPGARTSDFGTWHKIGDSRYDAASEALVLAQSGPFPPGTQRIVQAIEVNGDSFTSAAEVTFFDRNHNTVLSTCALASGRRFE